MSSARWLRELDGRDAYEILGVAPTATSQEIRKARRSRLTTAHPDAGANSDHLAKLITSAADILLDADQRGEYDRWRARAASAPPRPSVWDDATPGRTAAPTHPAPGPASVWDDATPGFKAAPTRPAPGPASVWDDATPGFKAAPTRPAPGPAPADPYRGVTPPWPPGPPPAPGPGPAPSYGSPSVVPHWGQPPPQYYHQPQTAHSRTGLVVLIASAGVLLLCLGACVLNSLLLR